MSSYLSDVEVETEVKGQLKEEEEEVIDVDDDVEMDDEDTKQDTLKTETTTCIGMYRWKNKIAPPLIYVVHAYSSIIVKSVAFFQMKFRI